MLPPVRLMPPVRPLQAGAAELRSQVRGFLSAERTAGRFVPACDAWLSGWDESFSRRLGERGWVGMTRPSEYGGHGRSALERYVVIEELLAAGAPVAAHWVADRQVGPNLLRYGSEQRKRRYLPAIAAGTCYFAIGLSEPDVGSDLAAVRTRGRAARRRLECVRHQDVDQRRAPRARAHRAGAHRAARRRSGTPASASCSSNSPPGVTIRPIISMTGEHHFNEVVFDDVVVPDDMVLGTIGDGWAQVTAELAYERSGPERFLSTYCCSLVAEFAPVERPGRATRPRRPALGRWSPGCGRCGRCRCGPGRSPRARLPEIAAALVKDVGTRLESDDRSRCADGRR